MSFEKYLLIYLLKRAMIIYADRWTGKQISQIKNIIWKLENMD